MLGGRLHIIFDMFGNFPKLDIRPLNYCRNTSKLREIPHNFQTTCLTILAVESFDLLGKVGALEMNQIIFVGPITFFISIESQDGGISMKSLSSLNMLRILVPI